MTMAISIGIDLGTTNSVGAFVKKGSEPRVVDNHYDGEKITPSIVHLTEHDEWVVGEAARALAGKSPENTVFSIKRFMGRDFDDPTCAKDIKNAPYKVLGAEKGGVLVSLRGREFTPPEISAFILESVKQSAEAYVGDKVSHAVITVPAYFGTRQKEATRLAGKLAGLNVQLIVPEPTAAALTYGFSSEESEPRNILVYDLGGGTFDVTVMFTGAGLFRDQGKNGDMHLGGDDFDHKIMDWILEQMRIQKGVDIRAMKNTAEIMYKLKEESEKAKKRLSTTTRTQIVIPGLFKADGKFIDVECELLRDEFNAMIKPLVERSLDLVDKALNEARTTANDIETVLLVGGSSFVPLVLESIRGKFGDRVTKGETNPMHCVAQGAAIQTVLIKVDEAGEAEAEKELVQCKDCGSINLKGRKECRRCFSDLKGGKTPVHDGDKKPEFQCPKCGQLNPVGAEKCRNSECNEILPAGGVGVEHKTSHPIGVEIEGDQMEVIIPKGAVYPTEEKFVTVLYTIRPDQRRAQLPVYEGEETVAKKNDYLGLVEGELPAGLPLGTNVEVEMSINQNSILVVTASLPDNPNVKIEASIKWGQKLGEKEEPKKEPKKPRKGEEEPSVPDWKQQAFFSLFMIGAIKEEGEGFVPSSALDPLIQKGADLMNAVDEDDAGKAQEIIMELQFKLQRYEAFIALAMMRRLSQNPDVAEKVGLALLEKLNKIVDRADQAKQRGDMEGLNRVVSEGSPVFQEVMEKLGKDVPPITEEDIRLGKKKKK